MDLREVLASPAGVMVVLLTVIIVAPYVAERARLPGIIGLLIGGFLIGETGLDLVGGNAALEFIGDIGLLYLMTLAGLELDLKAFSRIRNSAIRFGLLTFILPFGLGLGIAIRLDYDLLAAILIGSLWASHTLVVYPVVRRYGLATNPAVSVTVGATVITDTLALLVLAVVAGSFIAGGFDPAVIVSLGIGLVVLLAYCFIVLPRMARGFFLGFGRERGLRFLFIFAGFLSAAVVADLAGIEGIVGAFFAGLALNRLVPRGSPLAEIVEFFGSSLFIPAFLVSVGLLIDPSVMFDPQTLVLAAGFLVAVTGGKLLAAVIAGRLGRYSAAEIGVMFSLSYAQAAATLAATKVGYDIGLFGEATVNAVVVVCVVSLIVVSLAASYFAARVAPREAEAARLGGTVVVPIDDAEAAPALVRLGQAIAVPDGGRIVPIHVHADDEDRPLADARTTALAVDEQVRASGVEAEPSFIVARSLVQGVRNAIVQHEGTMVLLGRAAGLPTAELVFGGRIDDFVAASPVPVVVAALSDRPIERVVVPVRAADLQVDRRVELGLAAELIGRLAESDLPVLVGVEPGAIVPASALPPEGVTREPMTGGRPAWLRATAKPGDLVVFPAGLGRWLFGVDAARIAALEGVSVAVISGPNRAGAAVPAMDTGSGVLGGTTA